ncbi:MAG: M56 family metallopeptidase [Armatimonadota bacterium]
MSSYILFLNAVSASWGEAMWRACWQGAIAILLVWGLCRLGKRWPPTVHSWLWRLVVIKLFLGLYFVGTLPLPVLPVPTEMLSYSMPPVMQPALQVVRPLLTEHPLPANPPAAPSPVLPSLPPVTAASWLFLLWLSGVLYGGALAVSAYRKLAMLRRQSQLVTDALTLDVVTALARQWGMRRPPVVRCHPTIDSPLVCGLFRPVIMLPTSLLTDADPGALRLIFTHELAHLKRQDLLWGGLLLFAQALFFFNPFFWLAHREWLLRQEIACDALALERTGAGGKEYGLVLWQVIRQRRLAGYALTAAGIGESSRTLKDRIVALKAFTPTTWKRIVLAGGILLVLSLVIIPSWRLVTSSNYLVADVPPIDPAKVGIVHGRVVTPAGKPFPGATVSWLGRESDEHGSDFQQLAIVRTDATGRFRFKDTKALYAKSGWSYGARLLVKADGYALTGSLVPKKGNSLTIPLMQPVTARLTVVDQQQRPIAGLRVTPVFVKAEKPPYWWVFFPPPLARELSQVTDAHGMCTFNNLPQDAKLRVRHEDDRFVQFNTSTNSFGRPDFADDISLGHTAAVESTHTLLPAATLEGAVTYGPTGKPASGVTLRVAVPTAATDYGVTRTGNDGQYRFRQLRGGKYTVVIASDGVLEKSWAAVARTGVSVPEGGHVTGLNFTLVSGAILTGTVTDRQTGEPISGARIAISGPGYPAEANAGALFAITDADGVYRCHVPAGTQQVRLNNSPPAYGYLLPEEHEQTVTVADGETATINFTLPRRSWWRRTTDSLVLRMSR